MADSENNLSRLNRKKGRKRSDKILNILITVVSLAIVITMIAIFSGDNKEEAKEDVALPEEVQPEEELEEELDESEDPTVEEVDEFDVLEEDDIEIEKDEDKDSGIVTYLYSDDKLIEQSIINPSWKSIATEQTGEHVSLYDKNSVDWKEKEEALAYATGLSLDDMITLWIKSGGSPQKSIGIVSSNDKVEKYRVYLEWVEGEGWKPEKLDQLKTLDFDYKN